MMSILDDRGRVLKTIHTDEHDPDRMVEVTHEDLDPIIEMAKSLAIVRQANRRNTQEGWRLAAFMPTFVVENMIRDGSWNDPQALKRWANDPQNKDFRVWGGRV